MTILWSSVYGVLVVEIGLLVALLVSLISTSWWCYLVAAINRLIEETSGKILQYSGVKTAIETLNATWVYDWRRKLFNAQMFFWTFVGFLGLLFLNCLRQLWMVEIIRTEHKYQAVDEMAKLVDNVNMFRAQRNVYISGLTLFLALVIKRVFSLVITLGRVRDERDKYKKFFTEQKDS
eukprot:GFUD01002457.1.p1 GENE.GFUD01002457.1~~GFUD01002457.1.p1  ORF type:complete len:178 (+),score=56.17 GFUD01002457.1:382-915(+)